ncbi:MAG: hypothetical protein KAT43_01345 [Nanoarchaeota archaeon]|nr:hypothetical protein [Nanoarchaeota archaeon]
MVALCSLLVIIGLVFVIIGTLGSIKFKMPWAISVSGAGMMILAMGLLLALIGKC